MKLMHVTIMTKCLDESIRFYEDAVGLTIQRDLRGKQEHPVVFLADSADETRVELGENPEGAFHGGGISLGFQVEDIRAERAKKEAMGLQPGPILSPNPDVEFFFVIDPNGVQIQFAQEK